MEGHIFRMSVQALCTDLHDTGTPVGAEDETYGF
jgi:hypothetical protein